MDPDPGLEKVPDQIQIWNPDPPPYSLGSAVEFSLVNPDIYLLRWTSAPVVLVLNDQLVLGTPLALFYVHEQHPAVQASLVMLRNVRFKESINYRGSF